MPNPPSPLPTMCHCNHRGCCKAPLFAEMLAALKFYHESDDLSFKIHKKANPDCSDCNLIRRAEKENQ